MKRKLLLLMIAAGTMLSAQVSLGIRIGPPPVIRYERMDNRRPGPDYIWVDGYWYPERNKYKWHKGYWTRAPFGGARWIAPRHDGLVLLREFAPSPGTIRHMSNSPCAICPK